MPKLLNRLVLVPILLFVLALLFFSALLSSALKRPSLRAPPFPISTKFNFSRFVMKSTTSEGTGNMSMPRFMYGTAWKKERTKELVELAVRTGFRGIDTACQPKHYHEPGVGDALQSLYSQGIISRSGVFLQTKFTSLNGQDPNRIPYDKDAPLSQQVHQSFNISCTNLRSEYIDSLVLHSPMAQFAETLTVWRAFEEIHAQGRVRQLGISNCYSLNTLKQLYSEAVVKPTVLQNRFYAESGYDEEVRQFCKENGIAYQSFWTLTANPHILKT